MLESRDACEFKLTKPLKFVTGRKDCVSDDPDGRAYVTTKHEVICYVFIGTYQGWRNWGAVLGVEPVLLKNLVLLRAPQIF